MMKRWVLICLILVLFIPVSVLAETRVDGGKVETYKRITTDTIRGDSTNGLAIDSDRDGTNEVIIDTSGNIGMSGETSPESSQEITSTAPYITLHNSTHEKTDGGMESRIRAKGEDPNGVEWHLGTIQFSHDGTSADGKGDIIFSNNDGNDADDTLQEKMRIDSIGNVGIGTTSPGVKLDVNGKVRLSSGAPEIQGYTGSIYNKLNFDALNYEWQTSGGVVDMALIAGGNLGIGTTSPDTLLHAEKSTALTSTQQEVIRISATTTETPAAGFGAGMGFELETDANSAGHMEVVGGIYGVIEDPTLDSENGAVTIKTKTAGATATEKWRVKSDGTIQHQMTGSVYEWSYQAEVADDGTFTLPSFTNGANGWFIIGDNEERAYFTVDNDGDTTLLTDCSANIASDANTDTQFCIGVAATTEPKTIKNRLGGAKNVFGKVYYY